MSVPPAPPSPDDTQWNPRNSYMTALGNACVANTMTLRMERSQEGLSHMPKWTSVCFINDEEYARASAFLVKSADNEAARLTLMKLRSEKPLFLPALRNYYPIFMDHVAKHDLKDRVLFESIHTGPAHMLSWTCTVKLDDNAIGKGTGKTKKDAQEDAAIEAAKKWLS